jgi:hypothetical protein
VDVYICSDHGCERSASSASVDVEEARSSSVESGSCDGRRTRRAASVVKVNVLETHAYLIGSEQGKPDA